MMPSRIVWGLLVLVLYTRCAEADSYATAMELAARGRKAAFDGSYAEAARLLESAQRKKQSALTPDDWMVMADALALSGKPSPAAYARAHAEYLKLDLSLTAGDGWLTKALAFTATVGAGVMNDYQSAQVGEFGGRRGTDGYNTFKSLGLKGPQGAKAWRERVKSARSDLTRLANQKHSAVRVCGSEIQSTPCAGLRSVITPAGVCPAVAVAKATYVSPAACIASHWQASSMIADAGLSEDSVSRIDSCFDQQGSTCDASDVGFVYLVAGSSYAFVQVGWPGWAAAGAQATDFDAIELGEMSDLFSWLVPVAQQCFPVIGVVVDCPGATQEWGALYGHRADTNPSWVFFGFHRTPQTVIRVSLGSGFARARERGLTYVRD